MALSRLNGFDLNRVHKVGIENWGGARGAVHEEGMGMDLVKRHYMHV